MTKPSIKIGTKRQVLWTQVKENIVKVIQEFEDELEVKREMLKRANEIIAEEEEK